MHIVIEIKPGSIKRLLFVGATLTALGTTVIANAGGLHMWSDGGTLEAKDLNANFGALDQRLSVLESNDDLANTKFGALDKRLSALESNDSLAALDRRVTAIEQGSHHPSAFRAHLNAATSVPVGSSPALAFGVEEFDLGGEYDPSTGTFMPNEAGVYILECSLSVVASGSWVLNAHIYDGATGAELVTRDTWAAGSNGNLLDAHSEGLVQLAAGQMVRCNSYQNSGSNQSLYISLWRRNYFAAARVY